MKQLCFEHVSTYIRHINLTSVILEPKQLGKKQVACSGLYSVLSITAGVLLTRTLWVRSPAAFKIQSEVAFQTGKREAKCNPYFYF